MARALSFLVVWHWKRGACGTAFAFNCGVFHACEEMHACTGILVSRAIVERFWYNIAGAALSTKSISLRPSALCVLTSNSLSRLIAPCLCALP